MDLYARCEKLMTDVTPSNIGVHILIVETFRQFIVLYL